jgi:hypothetical protein
MIDIEKQQRARGFTISRDSVGDEKYEILVRLNTLPVSVLKHLLNKGADRAPEISKTFSKTKSPKKSSPKDFVCSSMFSIMDLKPK